MVDGIIFYCYRYDELQEISGRADLPDLLFDIFIWQVM